MVALDMFSLEGKVALVTGASRGLGQAMALGLAEAGADIASLDVAECGETCGQVEALGRRSHSIACDLRQAIVDELSGVVAEVVHTLGRLDILVNNAGIIRRAPVLDFIEEDWDDVLQVNLKAVFFLSQAAARHMAAQGGGKIINIASMLSFQGGILVPSYTAAKATGLRVIRCEARIAGGKLEIKQIE